MNIQKHLKILALMLLLLNLSVPGQSQLLDATRKVIAVMPFENLQNDPEINWLSRGVQDTLTTKLSKVKVLRLVERGRLMDIVRELKRSKSKLVASETAAKSGRLIGAQIMLLGGFLKVGDLVQLTARFVEVETASVTQSTIQQGPIDEIFTLMDSIGYDLLSHLKIPVTAETRTHVAENPTRTIEAYQYFGKSFELYDFDTQAGDVDLAIQFLQKAVELDSNYVKARNNLGVAYFHKGEVDQAINAYRRVIDLDPNYADAYLNLGVVHYAAKEYSQAIDVVEKAIRLRPDFATAHRNLAEIYREAGQADPALQSYVKLTKIQGPTAGAYKGIGRIFFDLKAYDNAIAAYTKAVKIRPDYQTYLMMGVIAYNQGKYDASIDAYLRSIHLQETYQAYNNIGNAYRKRNEVEKAINAYLKATALEPDVPDGHYNLGYAYAAQGNAESAIQSYLKAIHLNPKYIKAHYGLAQVCQAKGDFDEKLLRAYQKEVRTHPDEGLYYYYMGISCANRGLTEESVSYLKTAFRLDDRYQRRARTDNAFDSMRSVPTFQAQMR